MKKLYVLVYLVLVCQLLHAQYSRHIVRLKDKKTTPYTLSNPSTYLTSKAIERRTKQNISIDSTDLPIAPAYLDSIRNVPNVSIINVSKWLNQVLITTSDSAAITKINSFPFVLTAYPIAAKARPNEEVLINKKFNEPVYPLQNRQLRNEARRFDLVNDVINYGASYNQVHIHEGEYLHNLGFTGKDITIAILDAGFYGYKTNPALDSARSQNRILREYDFVLNEQSVNEDHPHGLYCFSIIAANIPGSMVGSAPHANFLLFRTEDVFSEYPVEEQNWAAAAEVADSLGADMISSSLGYADFDDPLFNHLYAQRDGNTCISTIAADFAAKKGMIVMNSAGNSGGLVNDYKYVGCPADGDSVVAVGATDVNGNIAPFSSWGPNGAGKLKPNIVSVGQGTTIASTAGNPILGNGTSYSNPNAAGLVACLWQAFPEFTNMEIIDAVQKSSHKYNSPDERFGYGIPNFRKAHEILHKEREIRRAAAILGDKWIKAYPVPFRNTFNIILKAPASGSASLQLLDLTGRIIDRKVVSTTADQVYILNFSRSTLLARGVYYIRYSDGHNKQTLQVVKQ